MIVRRVVLTASGLIALVVLPGCETTAEKSAGLAAAGGTASSAERGLSVAKVDRAVRVLDKTAITDANGTAVIVTLRSTARGPVADVPIAIDVRSAAGKSLFRNDQPGAESGLVAVPLLSPGRSVSWVHDQVLAAGAPPASVVVRVGQARDASPPRPPRLTVSRLSVESDGAGGIEGRGRVRNHSSTVQRGVTVSAIARRGAKVVAAARAVVKSVKAGGSAPFAVYFIGDPAGARIALLATATAPAGGSR